MLGGIAVAAFAMGGTAGLVVGGVFLLWCLDGIVGRIVRVARKRTWVRSAARALRNDARATESLVRRDVVVEAEGVQRVECAFDRAEAGKALGPVLDLECVAGWLGRIVEVAAADRPGRED
jgi:hypothetical protein